MFDGLYFWDMHDMLIGNIADLSGQCQSQAAGGGKEGCGAGADGYF